MIIAVSGTPGCGKTTFAKQLAQHLNFDFVELTQYIKKHKLAEEFDEESQSLVVDIPTLNTHLHKQLNKKASYIIDGHFAHDLKNIDGCIVCTCELKELNKRLKKRNYSAEKIRENLDAEIFDTCFTESIENNIPTVKIECTKKVTQQQVKNTYQQLLIAMKQ